MNAIPSRLVIALLGTLAFPAAAQQLSPQEVKQYLSGAGMGYAKAAELNHFPGPMQQQVKRYDALRGNHHIH